MVADAEANAEADRERRELVEAKNQGEALIHSTRQSIKEHGDKVDPATIEAIELAMGALEETLKEDDVAKIRSGIQNLTDAAMKLGQAIYEATQKEAAEGGTEDTAASDDAKAAADDENVVDAEFEDVDDSKKS